MQAKKIAEVLIQELAGDVHKFVLPVHAMMILYHLRRGNKKTAIFWAVAAGMDIKGIYDHAKAKRNAIRR